MRQSDLLSSSRGSMGARPTQSRKTGLGVEKSINYDLDVISEEEFNLLHCYVKSIFDQGRQRFKMDLVTCTNKIALCPQEHWPYLTESDSLGVSMTAQGNPEEFHIWLTPAYKKPQFKFYMTLVHEMVHGYAGLKYDHGPQWRRWFYRTLWHLVQAGFIPEPLDELKYVCLSVEYTYCKAVKVDPMLTILEALNKAEQEHDIVNDNYFRRLRNA